NEKAEQSRIFQNITVHNYWRQVTFRRVFRFLANLFAREYKLKSVYGDAIALIGIDPLQSEADAMEQRLWSALEEDEPEKSGKGGQAT
ncbi:MAG: hypothetical protein LBG12_08080, partial [Synergistaceae bacterium]|nr:hypothetical protein [Synergistaceae bacterium]